MRTLSSHLIPRETAEFALDALGAVSLCVTFVAVLLLPGLF